MNSNAILQSDVLDIVFENRNKLYGAYNLRKFYKDRLLTSIGIMVLGVICFTSLSFLRTEKEDLLVTEDVRFGQVMPGKVQKQKRHYRGCQSYRTTIAATVLLKLNHCCPLGSSITAAELRNNQVSRCLRGTSLLKLTKRL